MTAIEWVTIPGDGKPGRTVNPIKARDKESGAVGHFCERVSPGCAHCYASTWQKRFHMHEFEPRNRSKITFFLDVKALASVIRRKAPTAYFWEDMSDLFGRWVSDAWLDACVATMAATPRHLHMLLTKRPERMRAYFEGLRDLSPADRLARIQAVGTSRAMKDAPRALVQAIANLTAIDVPLFRVILGTSVENQDTANARLPELLLTPAWQRFVSYEPALGSVTFRWAACTCADKPAAFRLKLHAATCPLAQGELCGMLHRIIYGGESGSGARPNWLMWPASVIRQGQELRIPVFIKQLGAFPTQTKIGTEFFEDHPTKVEKLVLTPAPGHTRPARKGNRPEEWPIVENAKGEPIDLRVRE